MKTVHIKQSQKVLLFSVAPQKVSKIEKMCKTLGILVKQVDKADYGQQIGAIAGITGFRKSATQSTITFPAEMLVFCGMNSAQIDVFLAEYKKSGIEPIGCKAIVTPDNVNWTADKLFRELLREHMFMNRS